MPGGPGSASYADTLTNDDVAAIRAGHCGYAPLRFYVISKISRGDMVPGNVLELVFWENGAWQVGEAFRRWNRLDTLLAHVRQYYGLRRGEYELSVTQ